MAEVIKCKWAGDESDEYCKSCDGIKMMVEGNEIPCDQCAGYEEGTKKVEVEGASVEEDTTEQVEEDVVEQTKSTQKQNKKSNNTPKKEKPVKNNSKKSQEVKKVAEEKHVEEDTEMVANGIQITSLRYTSSATVKKGDNYFKFTAEEEWNTSLYNGDIQDVREQLWAKLNSEVDKQIEDLNNM